MISATKLIEMYIDVASQLPTLWYENEDGDRWIPPKNFPTGECNAPPEGFIYQHSMFPSDLKHLILGPKEGGGSTEYASGSSTYSEDLVTAMVKQNAYPLFDSIMIAANACERCLNVLLHKYGLDDGYPEYSEQWQRSDTVCQFCERDVLNRPMRGSLA